MVFNPLLQSFQSPVSRIAERFSGMAGRHFRGRRAPSLPGPDERYQIIAVGVLQTALHSDLVFDCVAEPDTQEKGGKKQQNGEEIPVIMQNHRTRSPDDQKHHELGRKSKQPPLEDFSERVARFHPGHAETPLSPLAVTVSFGLSGLRMHSSGRFFPNAV